MYKYLEHQAKTTTPSSQKITEDTSHGRKITRTISVFPVVEPVSKEWANSQNFIRVQRSGNRGGKSYQETAYYLSSRQEIAEVFGDKIRGQLLFRVLAAVSVLLVALLLRVLALLLVALQRVALLVQLVALLFQLPLNRRQTLPSHYLGRRFSTRA